VSAEARSELVGFDFHEDRELAQHPRLRRVLTALVRPTPFFYGVLHWSDGADLKFLDREVISGEAKNTYFTGAVLAEPRTIACLNCGVQLRVLAIDTGQAMFAATLAERLRAHELKTTCPVCETRLGVQVVEFLHMGISP
jgi:hypothetical protein